MFKNLRAEMAREGVTTKKLAEGVGISERAFRNKFYGRTEFTRSEMLKIQNTYFPHLTLDYLFDLSDQKTA